MIREIKEGKSYNSLIAVLSVFTLIPGLLYSLLGEFITPVLIPLAASLFLFERPQKRILSYLVPTASIALAIAVNGLGGITVCIPFIAALVLVLCYRFSKSKAETSVYLTAIIFLGILLSFYFAGAKAAGSYGFTEVTEYYSGVLMEMRKIFVDAAKAMPTGEGAIGHGNFNYGTDITPELVGEAFDLLVSYLVGILLAVAFIIGGISVKIFTAIAFKNCKHGMLRSFSHFIPASLIAYVYVIVSIISAFPIGDSVFAISLTNLSLFLSVVFLYTGFRSISALAAAMPRRGFFTMIVVAAFIFMPTVAMQITSYLGAWFSITNSKSNDPEA